MTSSHVIADTASEDYAFDRRIRLEDLVDRGGLAELCKSFVSLFGIPVRIYSADGALVGDAAAPQLAICEMVNHSIPGRAACAATVSGAKNAAPEAGGETSHACFTGNNYRIVSVDYEGRQLGKIIIGPYAPVSFQEVPASLMDVDRSIPREKALPMLQEVPRAKTETVSRMAMHLKRALDLILFSGHKSLVTSQMHLASVRESYRELSEKNARLQEAYDRLKELDRLKSNFLATVSHELRTPLTSIIGYSEMLGEELGGPLTPEQKDFVKTIHEKGEHLLSLIKSLLDLSKLESGTMSLRRRPCVVSDVLQEVLTTLLPAARKKGVELKVDPDPEKSEIRGDPERLRQVFTNLVDNALKFTPPGGTVSMIARTEDDEGDQGPGFALLAPVATRVQVRVADTGIGIPIKERSRVFDAFYQVDSSQTREFGGTGLGLSIVKRLVEAHDGTIKIEDNTPNGTVFVTSFPTVTPSS